MTTKTYNVRLKFVRKTTAEWAAETTVLLAGEPGIEVLADGTEKEKLGNGVDLWSNLPYKTAVGISYFHNQPTPSNMWTMAHNLGFTPSVELFDTGSCEVEGSVVHPSNNVCIAYFTIPIAGFARLN